ncbi:MAG: DinB family protein [Planctomycetes bacterium]|nr:DinB family protein [Planctomycetota bacterium]
MTRLNSALDQIRAARKYTTDLLNNLNLDDWFRQPSEGVTHIGWQVGHLAVANYHLALVRIRGKQLPDNQTIPENDKRERSAVQHPVDHRIFTGCDGLRLQFAVTLF